MTKDLIPAPCVPLRTHFFPSFDYVGLFRKKKSVFHPQRSQLCFWPFLYILTISLTRSPPCRSLVIVFFFSSSPPSFLPFILVDVAVGTAPSLPPHSNWLPGSHHCHFLITNNPLWASLVRGLLDHHT